MVPQVGEVSQWVTVEHTDEHDASRYEEDRRELGALAARALEGAARGGGWLRMSDYVEKE